MKPPTSEQVRASQGARRTIFGAIVSGGLLAGILDLAFALIYFGGKGGRPIKVLQSIAAGVQGKAAYHGGAGTAALGVGLHFGIALGAAAVFCGMARCAPRALRWPVISGAVFGAGVYYFMNLVVLPLSALQTKGYPLTWEPWMLAAHVVLVGVPIAWMARRYLVCRGVDGVR